jgi:hypothetical protein
MYNTLKYETFFCLPHNFIIYCAIIRENCVQMLKFVIHFKQKVEKNFRLTGVVLQVDLVIRGLFVCEFAYSHFK